MPIAPGRCEFVAVTREVAELKGVFGGAGEAASIEAMKPPSPPGERWPDDRPEYERDDALHHAG